MKKFIPERFKDKVMIITGMARGIGKETAIRAAQEGADLVLIDKIEDEGLEVLEQVKAIGAKAIFLHLDMSIEESSKIMIEKTIEEYGRLDIAINNAGVMGNPNSMHNVPTEDMNYTMANNFYSVFFGCREEVAQFIRQETGGIIVNNASIAGVTGIAGNAPYNASKHAVNGLTKSMAIDYAKYGIRINSVNPAGTTTPLTQAAYAYVMEKINEAIAAGVDPEKISNMGGLKRKNLFQRELDADEQAAAILFLCSDDSSCFTGAMLQTDGGWTSY